MSVTLTIANDTDQSIVERYDCQCAWDGSAPRSDCLDCHGKGEVVFTSSRWQINMANGNFHTIFSALGLSTECCGDIDPRTLAKAIKAYIPGLAVRATVQEGNMISCGLDDDQVSRRLDVLLEIAEEAARREERIIWG